MMNTTKHSGSQSKMGMKAMKMMSDLGIELMMKNSLNGPSPRITLCPMT